MTETANTTGLQKIDVKFPIDAPDDFNFDVLLEIFGRWRLEHGEEIIDLADYLHVPEGPGCLLVSHLWHVGIDSTLGECGILISQRAGLTGDLTSRIRAVVKACLEKANRLLDEPSLSTLSIRLREFRITINDRTLYPNTDESDAAIRPEVEGLAGRLFASAIIDRESDPRRRLGYHVRGQEGVPENIDEAIRLIG